MAKKYKLIIKPETSFCQEVQSDTLFGHICWAIKYIYGESKLLEFLKLFEEKPPLIISSGFPSINNIDFIPKPVLRPLDIKEEKELEAKFLNKNYSEYAFYAALKFLNKQNFIPVEVLEIVKDNLSYFNLYNLIFEKGDNCPINFIKKPSECKNSGLDCYFFNKENKECPLSLNINLKIEDVYHNTINRLTNTVLEEGGLYSVINYFFDSKIIVYIVDDYFGFDEINKIFEFISVSGYGKDKSTGKGAFSFELIEEFNLPNSVSPNGFITLSNFFPEDNFKITGYYEIFTKFGKLGGDWSRKPGINPFKKPIIFIKPGSFIFTSPLKEYYGKLIKNVNVNPDIVQYGITLPLGVKVL